MSSQYNRSVSMAFRGGRLNRRSSRVSRYQPTQITRPGGTATTLLQKRDRLRVFDSGDDVTPRNLVHPLHATIGQLGERRTAFDPIVADNYDKSSKVETQRPSFATLSSFSSAYTIDDANAKTDKVEEDLGPRSPTRPLVLQDVVVALDAPSQYHLSKLEEEELDLEDEISILLKETDTMFLFELPQLIEYADTPEAQVLLRENEKYQCIREGKGRKTVNAETQTYEKYYKSIGTHAKRKSRRDCGTFVNDWVMYETFNQINDIHPSKSDETVESKKTKEINRFKFPASKIDKKEAAKQAYAYRYMDELEQQMAELMNTEPFQDVVRTALRILSSKTYDVAQKNFLGLIESDPCDPDFELVYGLELLWEHENELINGKTVAAFKWNPLKDTILAVGYGSANRDQKQQKSQASEGLLLIWSIKNPSLPDRSFQFNSPVSDLDWSKADPNLLAVGFYDGMIRIIDVSEKELTVVREAGRKYSPTFEPHWQVRWWTTKDNRFLKDNAEEQIFAGNQDGRILYYCYSEEADFVPHQIIRLQCIEGHVQGIRRANYGRDTEVPINRHTGIRVLRLHPKSPNEFYVGTEEGAIVRCSIDQPDFYLDHFLAHDGACYTMQYSPFCERIFLTCGADWFCRIWAEGVTEPLMEFSTRMTSVSAATWCPKISTIFATASLNEVCIWDIKRKSHRPASVTEVAPARARITQLEFTKTGKQIVAGDDRGTVYVHKLEGIPLLVLNQTETLAKTIGNALVIKPHLLKKVRKLGQPFDFEEFFD
ncbi:hypothetical protein TKK_0001909 [Trichogramma kaykai]